MKKSIEPISAEVNNIKSSQGKVKDAIVEMQSQMDATTASRDEAEQQISEPNTAPVIIIIYKLFNFLKIKTKTASNITQLNI